MLFTCSTHSLNYLSSSHLFLQTLPQKYSYCSPLGQGKSLLIFSFWWQNNPFSGSHSKLVSLVQQKLSYTNLFLRCYKLIFPCAKLKASNDCCSKLLLLSLLQIRLVCLSKVVVFARYFVDLLLLLFFSLHVC